MSFGGFMQEHLSLARHLTVDLAGRYDFERLPAGFNQDVHNLSPRIGLAWSTSPKSVFRGWVGIFFDRFVLANLTRAIEKNGSQAFEQVVDGSSAANLFTLTQGGSLANPATGIAPSISRSLATLSHRDSVTPTNLMGSAPLAVRAFPSPRTTGGWNCKRVLRFSSAVKEAAYKART